MVTDEAEEGLRGGRLVSVLIDNVLPPLGLRQRQAAKLWDWDGISENAETRRLLRGVAALINRTSPPPPPPPPLPPKPEPGPEPRPSSFSMRHPAMVPTLLLAVVFAVNFLQTTIDADTTLKQLGPDGGYPIGAAFSSFEAYVSFKSHDVTNKVAVQGFSISYFYLFPMITIFVAIALASRRSPLPYRTFSLAVVINYFASLPFFVFWPVPERWALPDSDAILLSDLWNESLIDYIRPISGLDNCFPSFHTSLTVILIATCYLYSVRMRTSVLCIGATIVLATYALGIHWIPDIVAGIGVGLGSVALAHRWTNNGKADFLWA